MEVMFATMEAMGRYDKYAKGAIGTMTGTGNSTRRSAQQSWVPPSNTQSTSRGGMSEHGPSPSTSSRPAKSNKGKSRANIQSDSGPRQIISGCFQLNVQNDNSFNNDYYGSRAKEGRQSKKDQDIEEVEEEDDQST
jgi:hypothetical protein